MNNVKDIVNYVQRAIETGDVSDLVTAYEIISENQRRNAENVSMPSDEAPAEEKDFEQDAFFAMKQKKNEEKKTLKKRKGSKQPSFISNETKAITSTTLPKPTRRVKRTKRKRTPGRKRG
tara:strand:+ start:577 stop:936 length:360 start_codon:yes stop_codon:yes gene_type:complete